jgi:hypothetical protein
LAATRVRHRLCSNGCLRSIQASNAPTLTRIATSAKPLSTADAPLRHGGCESTRRSFACAVVVRRRSLGLRWSAPGSLHFARRQPLQPLPWVCRCRPSAAPSAPGKPGSAAAADPSTRSAALHLLGAGSFAWLRWGGRALLVWGGCPTATPLQGAGKLGGR